MSYPSMDMVLERPTDADPDRGSRAGRSGGPRKPGAGKKTRKKRKKPRPPIWTTLLIVFGLLLALGSTVTIAGVKLAVHEATKSVGREELLPDAPGQQHATIKGAKNILLLGLDNRPDQKSTDLVRADSIIILHIPASHDAAYMVSIPRDFYTHIPAYPDSDFRGQSDKINAAFGFGNQKGGGMGGGVKLMAMTIKQNWGIDFDAAAVVDFTGFQQVVNVLGGVDMYVDQEVISLHIGHTKDGKFASPYKINSDGTINHKIAGVTPEVYHIGNQHLAPWQALDYVRQRDQLPHTDYDRQRHQQQFIKAIFKGILSKNTLGDPGKLKKVLDVVGKAMTIDNGHISIEDWIFGMKGITGDSMVTLKTNNGNYHSEKVGNLSVERLDADTVKLLGSIKDDTVANFVIEHPNLVVSNNGT